MSEPLTSLLRGVSFFKGLSEDALEAVAARMVRRSAPAGQILFRKGERARGVYLLTEGRVEIYRSTSDGREQVLHSELPVQSVAELPVFDGGEYPASGRTAEACELFFLSIDDFQRLYREQPEIADAIIRSLGKRLRALVKVVERVSLRSVPSRVASLLLDYAGKAGPLADSAEFRLNRTQAELAHELATSRESVARALAGLRKKGIISQEGRKIRILSVVELEHVSLGDEGPLLRP